MSIFSQSLALMHKISSLTSPNPITLPFKVFHRLCVCVYTHRYTISQFYICAHSQSDRFLHRKFLLPPPLCRCIFPPFPDSWSLFKQYSPKSGFVFVCQNGIVKYCREVVSVVIMYKTRFCHSHSTLRCPICYFCSVFNDCQASLYFQVHLIVTWQFDLN